MFSLWYLLLFNGRSWWWQVLFWVFSLLVKVQWKLELLEVTPHCHWASLPRSLHRWLHCWVSGFLGPSIGVLCLDWTLALQSSMLSAYCPFLFPMGLKLTQLQGSSSAFSLKGSQNCPKIFLLLSNSQRHGAQKVTLTQTVAEAKRWVRRTKIPCAYGSGQSTAWVASHEALLPWWCH